MPRFKYLAFDWMDDKAQRRQIRFDLLAGVLEKDGVIGK